MTRLSTRAVLLILLAAAILALGVGAVARPGAQDAATPTPVPRPLLIRPSATTASHLATCPEPHDAASPVAPDPGPAAGSAVGLDEANRRYTDAIYGWSVTWDPADWPSGVSASIDHDGYPVLNLAAAPPLCTLWEPGHHGEEFRQAEQDWTVRLRSTDAAHPEFPAQEDGAFGPGDPTSCLRAGDGSDVEAVTDAEGRPLREVTADRAWEVVPSDIFDTVTYRECRVLVPGVSLLAIQGEIAPERYADQAPVLAALLATIRIPAAGAWTPAAVPTPLPTATPVTRTVSGETLARLTMRDIFGSAIQMRAGETRDLDLGVVDCCYYRTVAPVAAVWSVAPTEGATIDPGTGILTIDPATPSGSVFTVNADIENGRRVITEDIVVYSPEAAPLVGYWREQTHLACGTGTEVAPASAIQEVIFRADGTFSVTWHPFEVYKDYWGTYTFDLARGTVELVVEGGNYVPPDIDGSGTFAVDGDGWLVLTDLWLGSPTSGYLMATPPPGGGQRQACGHRFYRPGSAAADQAAATPHQAMAVTPEPAVTPTMATVPAAGTPPPTTGGVCVVVRDRPTFPALVRADGAVAGECGPPADPDARVFLAVEATWTTATGPMRALVRRVEVGAGGRADFGLVVNLEGAPRTVVPLRAGEHWSVAGCDIAPSATPSPSATPAATVDCLTPGQAATEPAEGARIDPATGVLTVDPATPAGRRFIVSAVFEVGSERHERTVEVIVVPGAAVAATPASNPSTVLLRAPVVLPPGPVAVRVERYRFDGGSQTRLDATTVPLALVVDAGLIDVEVTGPALYLPPNAPPDATGELLLPGERLSLGPGDQVVAIGSGGPTLRTAGRETAEVLVVRFSGGGSSGGIAGTPDAADGVAVTILIDGELAGRPAGPTSFTLNRVELTPGATWGPIGIVVGNGFFAPEAGTLAMDLTAGAGVVWQGGVTRTFAPGIETGPEAVLAPGDTALVEPGTWIILTNPGSDRMVGLDLIVRLEPRGS